MPKGIVTRLIVAMHQLISKSWYVWKTGVLVEKDGGFAEIIEHADLRQIRIRCWGTQ